MMDSRLDPVDLEGRMRYNKCLIIKELYMPKNKVQFQKGVTVRAVREGRLGS